MCANRTHFVALFW